MQHGLLCKCVSASIPGRRPDCHRGVADRLHCLCVRRLGGVHRHPPQDEDEEAHRVQEEEGQLRHHRPHILRLLPHSVLHLQRPLLDLHMLEQTRGAGKVADSEKTVKMAASTENKT